MASNEVIVTFNQNGGTGTQEQLKGDTSKGRIVLKAPKCTFIAPTNKAFKTWSKAANDEKATFNEGADLAFSSGVSLTLFAIWQDANSGAGENQGGNENNQGNTNPPAVSEDLAELLKPENKEKFLARIAELLSKNNAWLEQVKMTLFAVYHLELAFHSLNKNYEFALSECARILGEVKALQEENKAYLEHLIQGFDTDYKAKLAALELNFAEKKALIDEAGQIAQKVFKIHEELLRLSDSVKADLEHMEELAVEIKQIDENIKAAKLDEKLALFEARYKELNAFGDELEKFINTSKEEVIKLNEEFKTQAAQALKELERAKNESLEAIIKSKQDVLDEIDKARADFDGVRLIAVSNANEILNIYKLMKGNTNGKQ